MTRRQYNLWGRWKLKLYSAPVQCHFMIHFIGFWCGFEWFAVDSTVKLDYNITANTYNIGLLGLLCAVISVVGMAAAYLESERIQVPILRAICAGMNGILITPMVFEGLYSGLSTGLYPAFAFAQPAWGLCNLYLLYCSISDLRACYDRVEDGN